MIARTLAMAVGLLGATTVSQLPEFTQQYRQRLGGAIDELRVVVERFDRDAGAAGLTREDALRRMDNGDPFLRRRGVSEVEAKARLDTLQRQQQAMREAGPAERIVVFLQERDPLLSERTLADFEPAMPVTTEGFAAAAAGFLAGYFGIRIVTAPFGRRRVRRA